MIWRFALLSAFLTSGTTMADEAWMVDYEAALARAAKEKKDLLIDFTGSDWCGWCIRLKDEVFSKEAFLKGAQKNFVLVEIDFPRSKELPAERKKQNDGLGAAFGIQGYPTIFLTDATGRAYARTGYQPGGPQKYLEHLDTLREQRKKRDESLAKAEKAKGLERARLLDSALNPLAEAGVLVGYDELIREIVALDPEGEAGLRSKYEEILWQKKVGELGMQVQELLDGEKFDEALAKIDGWIRDLGLEGERKQMLFYFKFVTLETKGEPQLATESLTEAYELAPDSRVGTQIKRILDERR